MFIQTIILVQLLVVGAVPLAGGNVGNHSEVFPRQAYNVSGYTYTPPVERNAFPKLWFYDGKRGLFCSFARDIV